MKSHNLSSNPVSNTDKLPYDKPVQYIPLGSDVIRMPEVTTLEEKVFLLAYLDTGARRSEIFRWTFPEIQSPPKSLPNNEKEGKPLGLTS